MKQIVFIHGGEAYSREEDYVLDLRKQKLEREDILYKEKVRWHYVPQLQYTLGEEWEIIRPNMPCDANAKYEHWKIHFEKHIPFLEEGVVLVGHSLGAMFLARYLSENPLPITPSKLLLVSGAFTRENEEIGEDGEYFFVHLNNFDALSKACEKTYIIHSEDDFVVPYKHALFFKEHIPTAVFASFKDKGHFLYEECEEIIKLILE